MTLQLEQNYFNFDKNKAFQLYSWSTISPYAFLMYLCGFSLLQYFKDIFFIVLNILAFGKIAYFHLL